MLPALCIGHRVELARPQAGCVHSCFEGAVNLLIEGNLWSLLDGARSDLPFGIRLATGTAPGRLELRVGQPVQAKAGYLGVGPLTIDCRMAMRWWPRGWSVPTAGLAARLDRVERIAAPRAWRDSAEMAVAVTEALLRRGPGAAAMLSGTVGRVVGRGPGLTPAGDDVLVGILTVLGSTAARPMGASLRARLVAALRPWLGTTGDISRQLLQQVMQGSPGRALHELGQAVVEGMDEAAMQSALERLLDSGGSSGADGCIGLIAACRRLWLPAERAIA